MVLGMKKFSGVVKAYICDKVFRDQVSFATAN